MAHDSVAGEPGTADWIAVDWGHQTLHAWAMRSGDGVATVTGKADHPDGPEAALLALIGPWLRGGPVDVRACGWLAGHGGWHPAPGRAVPCLPVTADSRISVPTADPRLRVTAVPGLKQASPPDLMHGDETRIAGVLALHPDFDGVICLPGPRCSWAQVSAGEVVSFQTTMTGELITLLGTQSTLHAHLGGDGWDAPAFDGAVADAMSHPSRLATRLSGLHAATLLGDLPPGAARARLSGLLIGLDLAAARAYWLGQSVLVAGEGNLADLFCRALSAQGAAPRRISAALATRTGLGLTHAGGN